MNYKNFKRIKALVTFFIVAIVAIAILVQKIVLALAGAAIGIIFLFLVRGKTKTVLTDERTESIAGQAARLTYVILTISVAFLSLVFISSGRRTGQADYEALGIILSYITLFSLALYSLSYKYISNKYGEKDDE